MAQMSRSEMYNEAWMYYLTGKMSIEEIAEALNIPLATLRSYAGQHKWKQRQMEIHAKAGEGLKRKLAERIEKARMAYLNHALDSLDETQTAIAEMVVGRPHPHKKPSKEGEEAPTVIVNDKLAVMEQQHRIASSVLKLDDHQDGDENDEGFRILIAMQAKPHPTNSEACMGILRSKNALPDGSDEAENHPFLAESGDAGTNDAEADAIADDELVKMLRNEGYDAHDITHHVAETGEIPATPPKRKPMPKRVTFI